MHPIETPELKRLNCALFGTFEGLDINNYLNADDVISRTNQFLSDESLVIGTQRKYYGQLYNKLDSIIEFPEDIIQVYKNKYTEIDKLYCQQIKERNLGKPLINSQQMSEIIAGINSSIAATTHQSIKIIGYFFLCIDYSQSDMLLMRFKDFLATTIDPELNCPNYLDISNGKWTVNDFSFTISPSFCAYVKEQHGIKSRTNYKWLVGQNKTFSPYTGNNTSTLSNVFTKSFGLKFNDLIDKFRHHSMWLDENPIQIECPPVIEHKVDVIPEQEGIPKLSLKLKFKTLPQ